MFKIFIILLLFLGICTIAGMFVFLSSFDIRDGLEALVEKEE